MPPRPSRTSSSDVVEWARGSASYPIQLEELPDPPAVLYAVGDRGVLDRTVVTIVGSRRATPYGERVARLLSTELARAGACIVSGLAVGIDAATHRACIAVGGASCAVLGTGIDVIYPIENRELCEGIGLVLSEYGPGVGGRRWSFPQRNRILAGLASVVIVVEAAQKSGALITAEVALELGRTVAAVPGPIDAPGSVGTNALIRDGAHVITDAWDALILAGFSTSRPTTWGTTWGTSATVTQTADEAALVAALRGGSAPAEILALRARLPADRCLAALSALETAGAVTAGTDGVFHSM
jgi:DNA processing protein